MDKLINKFGVILIMYMLSIALFMYAAISIHNYQDRSVRQMTEQFTDRAREKGYISLAMYEGYMASISRFPVTINFYHTERYRINGLDSDNTIDERLIVKEIYENGIYKFNQNNNEEKDDFQVVVIERSPTLLAILIGQLNREQAKLYESCKKGGMVHNVPYD